MKNIINKIIAVEGLDKTGKSTFVNTFDSVYHGLYGSEGNTLQKFSFPNVNTPIGKSIRTELESINPDPNIVSTPNFLAEMCHYWMGEIYDNHYNNVSNQGTETNNINVNVKPVGTKNYIFDRYFISTLAYQAFYNDSKADLDFIKSMLNTNSFLKHPTDIIMLDLPNSIIIERTLSDNDAGLSDSNDTTDETILNKRRDAYTKAIKFLSGSGINIHWFDDVSKLDTHDIVKVLMGKIFK